MVGILGALAVNVKSMGVTAAGKKIKTMGSQFSKMSKTIKPMLDRLTVGFKKFGAVAGGAMGLLIAASPLLRAKMEILNIRIQQLVRSFQDALVPAIELVTDLVMKAITWWESLPESLQEAIIFGMQVVVMLGLLALAWTAVSIAMSPVTLAILAIIAVAALLYLAWTTNFLGIQEITAAVFGTIGALIKGFVSLITGWAAFFGTILKGIVGGFESWFTSIQTIVNNVIGIFKGIVDFIKAIFKGDLKGALSAIEDIFKKSFKAAEEWIMLPLRFIQGLIKGITGVDIIGKMINAGKELIGAFIKGAQKAIADAGKILTDVLNFIGDLFGGSLPERGPLINIEKWGAELGQAYVVNIGEGISRNISSVDRSLRIDTLEMIIEGSDMETSSDLFGELSDLRKSTAW